MNSVIEICSDGKIIEVLTGGIVLTGGGGGGGATNLAYTASPTNGIVTSDTGTDATIPAGSATNASLMLPADKTKLDSITVDTATVVRKLVRNQTGATIPKGTAVYQLGSSGIVMTVAPADASSEATAAQTLGITQEAIADNTNGYVVAVGLLDGVNTSALTEGQIVWLSETAGQLTTTRPTQPAHGVVCGYCVKQGGGASGILYVKVDNGLELNELHDVLLTGAVTGNVLAKFADGLWKPLALDKTSVGLGNVDNTSDANKPISTATQTALNAKQDTLISGTNIKTINGNSILGSGNLSISGGGGATNLAYTASATNGIVTSDTGTSATIPAGSTTNASLMLPADKSKLDGIATGATANSTDAFLLSRANHTGSQAISTVTGLQTALDGKEPSITAGTTAQYYRGDKTFQTLDKSSVGLSNVDNTSDANKPISTATQTALNAKENTITAGTISQYFRGDKTFQTLDKSAVGLSNVDNTSDLNKPISTATQTALNAKQNTITTGTISQYFRGDLSLATLDKTAVGLSNVANVDTTTTANITDSSNKRFITDAQQTVLNNTSGTNTGDNATNTTSNTYADGKVADAITDGVTTIAPSQNAVFDALAGKLGTTLTSANILVGNGSNVATGVAMSGDATLSNTGVLTIANNAVTLADMAQVATATVLGRNTAGTGDVEAIPNATLKTALSLDRASNITVFTSTSAPSVGDGVNGDVWIQFTP